MTLSRAVVGSTPVLTLRATESGGSSVDPDPDSVTATLTRVSDGEDLTDLTTLTGPVDHTYTLTIDTGATAALDALTVTWVVVGGDQTTTATDTVEVVGGRLFTLAEARASDSSIADPNVFPASEVDARRLEVELEAEAICGRSFFPRFRRVAVDGSGLVRLIVPDTDLRAVRDVTVTSAGPTETAWTAGQVGMVATGGGGLLTRLDGGIWPRGASNITVGYEHGLDAPPEDLRQAALIRLRGVLKRNRSGVPDRVASYTNEAGTFRIAMPGARKTGIPDVDAAYERWSVPAFGFG